MKIYTTLTFLILTTSLSGQVGNYNLKKDYSKEKLKTVEYCSYFKTTINETDKILTGYYHFNIGKVVEEINRNSRTYFYWDNKLFSVFDSKINKQLFFKGDFKNAGEKLYGFYSKKANEYQTLFEPYFVKTNVNISFNSRYRPQYYKYEYYAQSPRTILKELDCIIKEDERFEVKQMSIFYMGLGIDIEYKVDNCNIPDKIKNIAEDRGSRFYFNIYLTDKKSNITISLPEIIY